MGSSSSVFFESNYYHLMSRGINKQVIFENDSDYARYLSYLSKYSKQYKVEIIAYCLMNNHVHLLVFDPYNHKSEMMKYLNQCYAMGYNRKYNHTGSLIQNRFKRIMIKDLRYLVNVFYYVLKNPLRAQICKAEHYPWNSYKEYFKSNQIINNEIAKTIYGDEKNLQFVIKEDDSSSIIIRHNPVKDAFVREILLNRYNIASIKEVSHLSIPLRNEILRLLKNQGVIIKEISRLTGLSRGIIQRA